MKEITDYKTICSSNLNDFDEVIREHIKEGWQPQGSSYTFLEQLNLTEQRPSDYVKLLHFQTMVKY